MKNTLYLTQTDTTIGFVSQNSSKIDKAKKRLSNKHYICVVDSLEMLKHFSRVPNSHKNRVRRSKKTTFIMPNGLSFRVVKETKHNLLLDRFRWLYSSSANLSGYSYDKLYAISVADVIVSYLSQRGKPSNIYRLSKKIAIKIVR